MIHFPLFFQPPFNSDEWRRKESRNVSIFNFILEVRSISNFKRAGDEINKRRSQSQDSFLLFYSIESDKGTSLPTACLVHILEANLVHLKYIKTDKKNKGCLWTSRILKYEICQDLFSRMKAETHMLTSFVCRGH